MLVASPTKTFARSAEQPRHGNRVVLAEDDPDIRRLVASVLTRAGYETESHPDGGSALAARNSSHRDDTAAPTLFLLDIQMPNLTGLELCRRLRADPATSQSRIVLMSAGSPETATGALAAGADAYLPKPFSCAELVRQIDHLMALDRPVPQREELAATA